MGKHENNCSPRLDGKPDGPIEAWRRSNPRLSSAVVVFSDVDQVAHRHSHPMEGKPGATLQLLRQIGLLETKVGGQQIDPREDPRILSQADTLGRLALTSLYGRLGKIDPRLPGAGATWSVRDWIVFHGWAGIELDGRTIETSSVITWARPAPSVSISSRFHLPKVSRWTVSLEWLADLLLFERSWDDPTEKIGTQGIRLERDHQGRFLPWSGLRLDESAQAWIVGNQNTWRD